MTISIPSRIPFTHQKRNNYSHQPTSTKQRLRHSQYSTEMGLLHYREVSTSCVSFAYSQPVERASESEKNA